MTSRSSKYHFSSVYFRPEEYEAVTENAKTLGMSRNAMIKLALSKFFEASKAKLKKMDIVSTETSEAPKSSALSIDYKEEGL